MPGWPLAPGRTAHGAPFSAQLWTPPTPPQDDNDIYVDPVLCLTYETTPILESKLPPVYVRKERRRHRTDPSGAPSRPGRQGVAWGKRRACGLRSVWAGEPVVGPKTPPQLPFLSLLACPRGQSLLAQGCARRALCPVAGRKKKQRHGEPVVPPRSLFDRATPGMLKMRREGKEQKKNILLKQQTQFAKPLPTFAKPTAESGPDNPEWLISEDWALLQVSVAHRPRPVPSRPHPRVIALGQACAPADAAR